MPSTISFDKAWELAEPVRPDSRLWAMVGVGGDELTAFGVDLAEAGGFVIGGPSKSGRSTALLSVARSLLAGGADVVALCPRPSPLTELEAEVLRGAPSGADVSSALAAHDGPLAIVIDDAEAFSRSEADDAVKDFLKASGQGRVAVVVAGQLDDLKSELRGTIVEARKAKAGLLLSPPSTLDGELVGLRLTRNLIGRMPAGRGLLASNGEAIPIQVPL
jgi:S-DNA-T family DNA segregation ATPase FtsK/SpoIIIE